VTYQYSNGNVIFSTSPFGILSSLVPRTSVAFEIDGIDEQDHSGWSVLMLGFAQAMAHDLPANEGVGTGPVPSAEGTRNLFIEITPRTMSGRSVTRH
jgi:hypothetical protein